MRNDRNKKRKHKPESTSGLTEELTEDEQMLIQDILEAHRDTLPANENGANLPLNTVSGAGRSGCLGLKGFDD